MNSLTGFLEWTERACDPLLLPLAIVCGLVLAAAALSFLALFRSRAGASAAIEQAREIAARQQTDLDALQSAIVSLAAQVREIQDQPALAVVPGIPKPGLNLSKRSQALRMHRMGEPPERIAAALEIPRQEVELLLKVHRIVIRAL